MENKDNKALRAAFWLLGPLLFYELCTEAAGLACSLFGTQDALLVTGGGALLALPFLYAAYRKKLHGCRKKKPSVISSQARLWSLRMWRFRLMDLCGVKGCNDPGAVSRIMRS